MTDAPLDQVCNGNVGQGQYSQDDQVFEKDDWEDCAQDDIRAIGQLKWNKF
jgi:hypothetical protein